MTSLVEILVRLIYFTGGAFLRNYLEHNDEVKYVDGLLANSQDWDWFTELIEANYDIEDVNDWGAFRGSHLNQIFSKYIKILEIYKGELSVSNSILKEIINIAKFYIGINTVDDCKDLLCSNYSKLLFLIVWVTKLENNQNKEQFFTDFRLFITRNAWEIIDITDIKLYDAEILEYADLIKVSNFEEFRKCFKDNIAEIKYPVSDGFIDKYKDNLYSVNAFSYQYIERPAILSWQEEYILSMLRTLIKGGKISPAISGYNYKNPDTDVWNDDVIKILKSYFSSDIADFVLDTVNYIKNGIKPSAEILYKHCELLLNLMDSTEEEFDVITSSSFDILKWSFLNKDMNILNGDVRYIEFIKRIHKIDSLYMMKAMFDASYPLSGEQKKQIKQMYADQYKSIEKVDDIHALSDYLSNEDIPKQITTEYLEMVASKFNKVIESTKTIQVANIFYKYMIFLIKANNGKNVDKRLVKNEMIRIQRIWQDDYYKQQTELLEVHTFSTSIPTKEVDLFNNILLINPILIAKQCMVLDEPSILKIMEETAENAFAYMFQNMLLSSTFPESRDSINYEHHEIDSELKNIVEDIKERMRYKFLNDVSSDTHMIALHQHYRHSVTTTASLFKDEEKLYDYLNEYLDYDLIPYESKLTLAHLTQLFPALEIQIRKLGSMVGVVPFKESLKDFAKFKDSSSVLREVILSVKNEIGSFENIPDLMFVYNCMYNGNSINVRNDCMHGRNYLSGGQLRFAFKITLISLYMIIYRINSINQNMNNE